jgi:hypothetical protein
MAVSHFLQLKKISIKNLKGKKILCKSLPDFFFKSGGNGPYFTGKKTGV